jgi:hypothetical protein
MVIRYDLLICIRGNTGWFTYNFNEEGCKAMANFLEFLKSGKSAREFIDAAVLPQNVLPVTKTPTSPEPYQNEDLDNPESTDAVLNNIENMPPERPSSEGYDKEGEDGQAHPLFTEHEEDEADPAFLAALDAAEKEGIE